VLASALATSPGRLATALCSTLPTTWAPTLPTFLDSMSSPPSDEHYLRGPTDALRRVPVNDRYRIVVIAWEGWHSQLVEKVAWVRSWATRLSYACRPAAAVDLLEGHHHTVPSEQLRAGRRRLARDHKASGPGQGAEGRPVGVRVASASLASPAKRCPAVTVRPTMPGTVTRSARRSESAMARWSGVCRCASTRPADHVFWRGLEADAA